MSPKPEQKSSPFNAPPGSRKATWYIVLFFLIWAFVLYGNTLLNQHAMDDDRISNATEFQVFQQEHPGWSHTANVVTYFFLSVLLFFLLKRMLNNFNILFIFLVTVLFLAHPVHTEVVANLKYRDILLTFLFGLGMLHFLLKFGESGKYIYLVPGVILLTAGYISKHTVIPFVLISPLVFHFFTGMNPRRYLPVSGGLFLVAILLWILSGWFLPDREPVAGVVGNPLFVDHGFRSRIGISLVSLLFYLRILIYPHPLLFYYGFNTIPITSPANLWALLSLLVYAWLLAVALVRFRERSLISFAILWYLVFIAVQSNLIFPVPGIVGERFAFGASLGFCLALVWLLFRLAGTEANSLTIELDARAKILVLFLLILIPYILLTLNRNREWQNSMELYARDMPYLENSAGANFHAARYLMKRALEDQDPVPQRSEIRGILEKSRNYFLRSIEMYPGNYQALYDLGTLSLALEHDPDSAIRFYERAIRLEPTADLCLRLSKLYSMTGDTIRSAYYLELAADTTVVPDPRLIPAGK